MVWLLFLYGGVFILSLLFSAIVSGGPPSVVPALLDGALLATLLALVWGAAGLLRLRYPARISLSIGIVMCAMAGLGSMAAASLHLTERNGGVLVYDQGRTTPAGLALRLAEVAFASLSLPLSLAARRRKGPRR